MLSPAKVFIENLCLKTQEIESPQTLIDEKNMSNIKQIKLENDINEDDNSSSEITKRGRGRPKKINKLISANTFINTQENGVVNDSVNTLITTNRKGIINFQKIFFCPFFEDGI